MAPPTDKPRLSQLDPREVAEHATALLGEHVVRLMFHLDPSIVWQRPSAESSSIGFTAALLTEYARTGRDPEESDDAPGAKLAVDRVQDLCTALYSMAGRPGTFEVPDLTQAVDGDEPTDPVAVVLVAAWARIGLQEGRAVTKRELAVLASMSAGQVRTLVRSGEIRADGAMVPAAEARRWLASRGVPGFGDAS